MGVAGCRRDDTVRAGPPREIPMRGKLSTSALLGIMMAVAGPQARADYFVLRDGTTVAGTVCAETGVIDVQTLDGPVSIEPTDVTARESAASLRGMLHQLSPVAHERGTRALVQLVLW